MMYRCVWLAEFGLCGCLFFQWCVAVLCSWTIWQMTSYFMTCLKVDEMNVSSFSSVAIPYNNQHSSIVIISNVSKWRLRDTHFLYELELDLWINTHKIIPRLLVKSTYSRKVCNHLFTSHLAVKIWPVIFPNRGYPTSQTWSTTVRTVGRSWVIKRCPNSSWYVCCFGSWRTGPAVCSFYRKIFPNIHQTVRRSWSPLAQDICTAPSTL